MGLWGRVWLVGCRVQWVTTFLQESYLLTLYWKSYMHWNHSAGSVSTHKDSTTDRGSFVIISSLFTIQGPFLLHRWAGLSDNVRPSESRVLCFSIISLQNAPWAGPCHYCSSHKQSTVAALRSTNPRRFQGHWELLTDDFPRLLHRVTAAPCSFQVPKYLARSSSHSSVLCGSPSLTRMVNIYLLWIWAWITHVWLMPL